MTPGRLSRAARAAMFAAVCVVLAAVGHVLMSGTDLPGWALLSAFAGTVGAAWCLAGRERGLPTVTGAAVAVQAALHTAFSLVQAAGRPPAPAGGSFAREWADFLMCGSGPAGSMPLREAMRIVDGAGLGAMVSRPPPGAPVADPHAGHTVHGAGSAWAGAGHEMAGMSASGMLAAHLLAAVLAGLWLAYTERGVFRLLRALAHWVWAPLRVLLGLPVRTPHRSGVRPRPGTGARVLRGRLLAHSLTSRGPPAEPAVL
ncbi:hypothetical protein GCM10023329_42630 [Streptomyces sanyensis]|uniref:Integral membrane protein n=1 Tax=Streptomyces sanyensis TaxID=568869 RepID=A0ABP9AYJ0_9ACTN